MHMPNIAFRRGDGENMMMIIGCPEVLVCDCHRDSGVTRTLYDHGFKHRRPVSQSSFRDDQEPAFK